MPKDTKKKKNAHYVELSDKAAKVINDIQGERQIADGFRTPIKALIIEIIENAKA